LLPLIVATPKTGTTVAADSIDLINEYDAGGMPFCLFE
jgi:hypothetical protein